jgi:hypothetical protein
MPDYGDWSDEELAEELTQLDRDVDYWQRTIANNRRVLNKSSQARDAVLDIIAQRAQHRGWRKK